MSRYVPTAEEQAAIDLLRLAGYAVVRQGTYDNLRKRIDQAEWEAEWRERDKESAHAYASQSHREERRLCDRLTDVVAAAAAQGVSIQAINDALHPPDRLSDAIKDVFWRATQYGQTEDGDVYAYLVTKGAMHRLIGAAQSAGIPAAFRVDQTSLPDAAPAAPVAPAGDDERGPV